MRRFGARAIDRLLPRFVRRLFASIRDDDVPGIAAEASYYVLFALFPFLLFVAAVARFLGPAPEISLVHLFSVLHRFLPTSTAAILTSFLEGPLRASPPYLLSAGILGILWAGSQGFAAILKALNRVYCARERRNWIKRRGLALAMMGVAAVALLAVLFTMDPGGLLSVWSSLPPVLTQVWAWARWPVLFAILTLVLGWFYTNVPCVERTRRWITPGGLVASFVWLLTSAGLAAYIDTRSKAYARLYGAVGDVIILLLWIYVGVFVMLVGAEINTALDRKTAPSTLPAGPERAPASSGRHAEPARRSA